MYNQTFKITTNMAPKECQQNQYNNQTHQFDSDAEKNNNQSYNQILVILHQLTF